MRMKALSRGSRFAAALGLSHTSPSLSFSVVSALSSVSVCSASDWSLILSSSASSFLLVFFEGPEPPALEVDGFPAEEVAVAARAWPRVTRALSVVGSLAGAEEEAGRVLGLDLLSTVLVGCVAARRLVFGTSGGGLALLGADDDAATFPALALVGVLVAGADMAFPRLRVVRLAAAAVVLVEGVLEVLSALAERVWRLCEVPTAGVFAARVLVVASVLVLGFELAGISSEPELEVELRRLFLLLVGLEDEGRGTCWARF